MLIGGLIVLATTVWGAVFVKEAGKTADKVGVASTRTFPMFFIFAGLAFGAWFVWSRK